MESDASDTGALTESAEHTTLIINPIIYAEVLIGYTTIEALDAALPSSKDLAAGHTSGAEG